MPNLLPGNPAKRGGEIETEDVRMFLLDRYASDNALDLDLFWSDEEIQSATRFAAMKFNEINPQTIIVDAARLPFGYCFLCGIAYQLYLMKLAQLQRNDLDYVAGNITVEINKRRIDHLMKMMPLYKEEFETSALSQKIAANLEAAYGCA